MVDGQGGGLWAFAWKSKAEEAKRKIEAKTMKRGSGLSSPMLYEGTR